MTDDVKRIVEALRHVGTSLTNDTLNCSACPMQEIPVEELDCGSKCPETLMHLAADLIEELTDVKDRLAGMEIMLTSAQSAAETWQRRAEAAERDLCTISDKYKICDGCKHDCGNGIMDCGMTLCDRDNLYAWRGPCAENGGDDHG